MTQRREKRKIKQVEVKLRFVVAGDDLDIDKVCSAAVAALKSYDATEILQGAGCNALGGLTWALQEVQT